MLGLVTVLMLLNTASVFAQTTKRPTSIDYAKRAEQFFHRVWSYYRVPEYQLFSEYYPKTHSDTINYMQQGATSRKVSYLWPLSGIVSASNLMVKLPGKATGYRPYLDSALLSMEAYRDTTRTPHGYQAYPAQFEKVDRYYDDNGLVGIDYADAYENTGNKRYLQKAKDAFEFILSGWSASMGGGVTWLEGVHDQKPACSNGMATLTALKLYRVTNDTTYLNWGLKFYNWMKCLRDSAGLYANDIKTADSTVNKVYWTYNSGSMLEASAILYQITGQASYLQEAQAIAAATYRHFGVAKKQGRVSILDVPWFVTVLFRGYDALYRIDKNPLYIQTIEENLLYAETHAKDNYGLFYQNWNAETDEKATAKWLLDEACMAELYCRLAMLRALN